MHQVIDTQNGNAVVAEFPTHRRCLNHSRKLEPLPTVRPSWWPDAPRRSWEWRYQIRPAPAPSPAELQERQAERDAINARRRAKA
jgi:hypothetical protein